MPAPPEPAAAPLTEDKARDILRAELSREAVHRLETFVGLLSAWGRTHNLIGRNEFGRIWSRHVMDSLALIAHANDGALIDLGSGAGFPGLVIAIAQPERPVTLVESVQRKAAFLTHAARACGARVTVRAARIEALPAEPFPTVTARALAPLSTLLALSERFFGAGTVGLFPKGREAATEVEEARAHHAFTAALAPSRTDPEAAIVIVRRPAHRQEDRRC